MAAPALNYLYIAVWASDIAFISTFRSWCNGRTFIPRDGMKITSVESSTSLLVSPQMQCPSCVKKWNDNNFKAVFSNTNWGDGKNVHIS